MSSGGEYEPKDSRNVTGTAHTKDARWSDNKEPAAKGNEYEPNDSRNITGTAKTEDGRWTSTASEPVPGVPDGNPFTAEEAAASPAKSNETERD